MIEMERHLRHSPPQPEHPLSPPTSSKHHCTSKLNAVMNPLVLSNFGPDNFLCQSSSSESSIGGFLQKRKAVNRSDSLYCNSSSVGDSSSAASSIDFLYISPTKEKKEEEEEKSLTPDQGIGASLTNSATSVPDFPHPSNPSTASSSTKIPSESNTLTITADIDEFVLSMLSTAHELSTFSVNDCYSPSSSSIMSKSLKREKPSPVFSSNSSSEVNNSLPRSDKASTEKSSPTETSNNQELDHLVDELSEVECLIKELDEASPPSANRPHPTPKFQQMDDTYTTNNYVTIVRSVTENQLKQKSKDDAFIRTSSWAANLPASHPSPPSAFSVTSVPTTPAMSRYRIMNSSMMKVSPDITSNTLPAEGDGYFTQYQAGSSHLTPQNRFTGFVRNFNQGRFKPVSITLNHPTSQNSGASLTRSEKHGSGKTKSENRPLLVKNAAFEVASALNNDACSIMDRSIEIDFEREYLLEVQPADTLQAVHDFAFHSLSSFVDRSVQMRIKQWGRGIKNLFGKHELIEQVDKNKLFGMPLYMIQALNGNGCPFPQFIMDIMQYIKEYGRNVDGIFRKNGGKKTVNEMAADCDKLHCYDPLPEKYKTMEKILDLASLLKLYLRALPQMLVPTELTEIIRSAVLATPLEKHFDIMQLMIYILPDEHREALLVLLDFLADIANSSDENLMGPYNLSVCFALTIFNLDTQTTSQSKTPLNRRKTIGGIGEKTKEINVITRAFATLITSRSSLDLIPPQILNAKSSHKKKSKDLKNAMPPLSEIGASESLKAFVQACFKECKEQWPKWQESIIEDGIHFSTREVNDACSLKSYKLQLTVDASPQHVLSCLLNHREKWDLMTASTSAAPLKQDYKEYIATINFNNYISDSSKTATVLRIWDDGENDKDGKAFVAEKSCKKNPLTINAYVYHSVFIVVPHPQGKSIVNYISRIDLKGKSLSWYEKTYRHLLISQMTRFANLFKTMSD